jgi:UPF0716 protein FxsA
LVLILALLIIVPLVELAVFIEVASIIGLWNAVGLLVLISLVGAWIVKRQGTATWQRAQLQITAGRTPTREMADAVLLLFAGLLLLFPGFITSAAGVLLLLPPVRMLVRRFLFKRWVGEVAVIRASYRGPIETTASDIGPNERGPGPGRPELGRQ